MIDSVGGFGPPGMGGADIKNPAGQAVREKMNAVLMDKTGLSEEELKTAMGNGELKGILDAAGISREDMNTFRLEAIEEVENEGLITSDQADRMSKKPPPPPRSGPAEMGQAMQTVLQQLIEDLGIESEEDLWSLIPENTTLWDFAKENGQTFDYASMFDTLI